MILASIAIGGAIGSVLRYLVQVQCANWFGTSFPYGTLLVNTLGSLLIGFLSVVFFERLIVSDEIRVAILVGVLGGFTTFSTFSLDTLNLIQQGSLLTAMSNIVLNAGLCISACFIGLFLAKTI